MRLCVVVWLPTITITITMPWQESAKWREMRAAGGHGPVRHDVFCLHCNKQIGTDVPAGDEAKCGFATDTPFDIFCSCAHAVKWSKANNKPVYIYGWNRIA